jgi:hypothetical protein
MALRMRSACWVTKATDTHAIRICNNYCFYTAKMVTRTRLNIIHTLSVVFVSHFVRLCTRYSLHYNYKWHIYLRRTLSTTEFRCDIFLLRRTHLWTLDEF